MSSQEKNITNKLVDICSEYILDKDASYLCREDCIVYFASFTGKEEDARYHKLKIREVVRIIKATRLNVKLQKELKGDHIITACQELGRVYDFGIRSGDMVAPHIFNYNVLPNSEDRSTYGIVMDGIAMEFKRLGYPCMKSKPILEIFYTVIGLLELPIPLRREVIKELKGSFTRLGYVYRHGVNRLLHKGERFPGMLLAGHRPADLIEVTPSISKKIEKYVLKSTKSL